MYRQLFPRTGTMSNNKYKGMEIILQKLIRKMMKIKLACLIVALAFSGLHAEVWSQEKKMDFRLGEIRLERLFEVLEQRTNLRFVFNHEAVQGYTVQADMKDKTVEEVLDAVLKDTPLEYEVLGGHIVISPRTVQQGQQQEVLTIRGTVTDATGAPMPGVTVMLKGTNFGTATDADGKYEMAIQKEHAGVLVFSFVGMKTQEIAVNGRTEINVKLEEDATELEDVVVTGIFTKAKESYTGAVSTVSKEKLQMYKGQNLLQTLKNIDVSLNIPMNNAMGSDPNQLPQMNIRGTSTLPMSLDELNETTRQSVNTPLVIMDGFEISLSKLMDYNDEEIENITILKDASATAIYGSRGANGVIVVQSKKPEPGKLKVTAGVGIALEIPDLTSYDLLGAADKLRLEEEVGLYRYENNPQYTLDYQKQYYKRLKDVLAGVDTDWLSQPLRTGVGQRYNLRLEGGNEEFRWGMALSYKDTEGAMKGSSRKVFDGTVTLSYTVKNLIFRNSTNISNTASKNSKYGSFSNYVQQQPYNRIHDENGNLIRYFDGLYATSQKVQNPLYDATLNTFDKSHDLGVINNFSIEWKVLPEFTLRGLFGISTNRKNSDTFYPAEHSKFNNSTYTGEAVLRKGSYTYGTGESFKYEGNVTASYSKTFNDRHQLYVGLDFSVSESNNKEYSFVAEGFSNQDLSFITNALQYQEGGSPSGEKTISRRVGVTGNVNYTYDNKYYVDGSYRTDGSSQFGANKRFASFWSAGLGWNIHREGFLQDHTDIVNSLRLKASYGLTGTVDFSKASVETMYAFSSGGRYVNWSTAHLQGLGNPDLTWQKTYETNVGLEFGFLENRISGSFDFYKKVTKGLLSSHDLPLAMGFSAFSDNTGEVENTGYEASLSGYIIRNPERAFNWMVSGQLVYNKNKVTKLSEAIKRQNEEFVSSSSVSDTAPAHLLFEGRSMYGLYVVRSLGIDPATGKEMFLDRNGNITNVWNTADRVYAGTDATYGSPYRGNASTTVQWKNLTFNMSFGYQWGGKSYNSTLIDRVEVTTGTIGARNVDSRVFNDRWHQPGDHTFFKGYSTETTNASSRFVMKDNWFEIQSVSLQYRWATENLRQATHLQSILLAVNMSDLWHFSSIRYERGTSYPFARNMQGTITLIF